MNASSISPDGKFLAAVGDSKQVFLHNGKGEREQIHTVSAAKDWGFSVAWNHSSQHYAVASQDGLVNVWDIRSTRVLSRFETGSVSR